MAENNGSMRVVPLQLVQPNPAALRGVKTDSTEFLELTESIKSKGVLNPIVVREAVDKDTGKKYLALVDGLHRWTAAKQAGKDDIPVHVITADDVEALEAQIVTNSQTIPTKKASFADALKRLLNYKPTLTKQDLAMRLGKSFAWLDQFLKIADLPEHVKTLVDDGNITITNAQALADLPPDEIEHYLDRAMTLPPQQFITMAKDRASELRNAARQGRAPRPKEFAPSPFLQGLAAIREESVSLNVGKSLINQFKAETALDGWRLAVDWMMNMDPISVEKQRVKYEEQKAQNEKKRQERREENARKAQEEAAERRVAVEVA
jgi:ParB/RepB/Spo0J family partition protein